MIVTCPRCATGYLLPEELMGSGGARVRCPRCGDSFTVTPAGHGTASPPGESPSPASFSEPVPALHEPSTEAGTAPTARADALAEARAVIAELADREGEPLARAAAERRLFTAYGPALMKAYDAYRQRAGMSADPAAFREAVRERWGLELLPLGGHATGT